MMNRIHLIPIIGLACLAVLSSCRKSHWKNDEMKQVFSAISYENEHMTCEAYRVDDSYAGERKIQDGEELHGYAIISDAVTLTFKSRKELSSIIGNPNTYFRHSIPIDCLYRPGIAFRFNNKKTSVDLLICFTCNELRYYLDGKIVGQSYFKSQNLRALVKKLFPKDKKIQSLKDGEKPS